MIKLDNLTSKSNPRSLILVFMTWQAIFWQIEKQVLLKSLENRSLFSRWYIYSFFCFSFFNGSKNEYIMANKLMFLQIASVKFLFTFLKSHFVFSKRNLVHHFLVYFAKLLYIQRQHPRLFIWSNQCSLISSCFFSLFLFLLNASGSLCIQF